MLNLVRNEHKRQVAGIQYRSNVAHVDLAVHQIIVDLHTDNIVPDGRIGKVCTTCRPVNTILTPLRPFRFIGKRLPREVRTKIHSHIIVLHKANLCKKETRITAQNDSFNNSKWICIVLPAYCENAPNPC